MIYQVVTALAILAAPPVIEGPEVIDAGTPVILTTEVVENTAYKWQILSNNAELKIYNICPVDEPAHQMCLLSTTSPGNYRIQLIAASIDDATVTPVIDIAEHLIEITGVIPGTPPGTPPVGVIAKTVRDLALLVGDKATAKSLAGVFLILSRQSFDTPAQLLAATDASVTLTIKGKSEKWKVFMTGLEVILKKLSSDGKLSTVEQHQVVWKQIAAGLSLAAK